MVSPFDTIDKMLKRFFRNFVAVMRIIGNMYLYRIYMYILIHTYAFVNINHVPDLLAIAVMF